jgi:hypothetical protein
VAFTTPDKAAPTARLRTPRLVAATGRRIDLNGVKDEARRSLATGNLGRELVLALPDLIDEGELDALFPTLVRVLRDRPREVQS